jgi:LmbE family N-acetylglucosaminyl deacetylase
MKRPTPNRALLLFSLVIRPATQVARVTALVAVLPAVLLAASTPPGPVYGAGPPPKEQHLDVLFVGAHPDDESDGLSTYGQWHEFDGVRTGVLTITRGEGGGNAAGTEEGPALGRLREAEERRAAGKAGITDIHYLDRPDFYYTVSAPLTAAVWGHRRTLEQIVRLVRETRPKVIVTMEPAPVPGQHGNHQEAGRLATEAYVLAADPAAFPDQITQDGLRPWRAGRLFRTGGASGPPGPACASHVTPADPSAVGYGVFAGRRSPASGGKTWALVEHEAQHMYATQGWAGLPDPNRIGCDYFTQIASRVPYPLDDHGPAAMLDGAVHPVSGGPPLGTEFFLTVAAAHDAFGVGPGRPFTVTAHVRSPEALGQAKVALSLPSGWTAVGDGGLETGGAGERVATFTVTPPRTAPYGRTRLAATLTTGHGSGQTTEPVEVRPAVTGVQQPLPQVADFDSWAARTGVPALAGRVRHVLTLGSGQARKIRVDLANTTSTDRSGTVTLGLPKGFTADAASRPYALAAGARGSVFFTVTDTDAALPTANQGGDHAYTITTTNSSGPAPDVRTAALELVPVVTVPRAAAAPTVDGVESAGEYPGPRLDLSRLWEGSPCGSAADCSASGTATWTPGALYFLIKVRDDKLGSVLDAVDCKRHWRTDSVEIAIDPRGDSDDTATTFKTGILPVTSDGRPCFERDADSHQGPGAETAPGMRVASTVTKPYTGYTIEAKIPFAALPAAVDPARLGLDLLVYDSDTEDRTGQTRIGWSTWGGVQGDPYRWGRARLPGYRPPAGMPTEAPPPTMPAYGQAGPQPAPGRSTVTAPVAHG